MRSGGSQHVEYLTYRLLAIIDGERRSETIINSLADKLLFVRSAVDTDRHHSLLIIERFTVDITNSFSGFFYGMDAKVKKLLEKQRKDLETTA